METVSIRELRGATLRDRARDGNPLAITNYRALIAVFIPVEPAWIEHVIDYNWSHVRQSIAEGEQAMASAAPLAMAGDVITEGDDAPVGAERRVTPERIAIPVAAGMAGASMVQTSRTRDVLEQLMAALTLPASMRQTEAAGPVERTVRIGELTAGLLEKAGEAGQTVAVTHERELIGIAIPVTPGLVQFLIEQNLSRVLSNIARGEKHLSTADELATLDEFVDQAVPGPSLERSRPPDER